MSGLASMAAQGLAAPGAAHAQVLAAADPTLASFYHQPWWLVVIKVLVVFLFLMIVTLFRDLGGAPGSSAACSSVRDRTGPGLSGLLQSLLDGVKLPLKEDIIPTNVDKLLFWLAPAIAVIPALRPASPASSRSALWSRSSACRPRCSLADLPVAVLLVLAMSSMAVYGAVLLAGWASSPRTRCSAGCAHRPR